MTEKYPGFFTAIFGGRKAEDPEPVKPKKKPKKKAEKKVLSETLAQREKMLLRLESEMKKTKVDTQVDDVEGEEDE